MRHADLQDRARAIRAHGGRHPRTAHFFAVEWRRELQCPSALQLAHRLRQTLEPGEPLRGFAAAEYEMRRDGNLHWLRLEQRRGALHPDRLDGLSADGAAILARRKCDPGGAAVVADSRRALPERRDRYGHRLLALMVEADQVAVHTHLKALAHGGNFEMVKDARVEIRNRGKCDHAVGIEPLYVDRAGRVEHDPVSRRRAADEAISWPGAAAAEIRSALGGVAGFVGGNQQ